MAFWNADAAQVNASPQDAATQRAFIQALTAQAAGFGPSGATQMLTQQANQAQNEAYAQAAAARGVNPALAMRNAMQTGATLQAKAGQEAAIARSREQLAAQGELGTAINTARSQDLQGAIAQAQLVNSANQYNAAANAGVAGGISSGLGTAAEMGGLFGGASLLGGSGKSLDPYSGTGYGPEDVGPPGPSVDNGGLQGPPQDDSAHAATGGMIRAKMAIGGNVGMGTMAHPSDFSKPFLTPARPPEPMFQPQASPLGLWAGLAPQAIGASGNTSKFDPRTDPYYGKYFQSGDAIVNGDLQFGKDHQFPHDAFNGNPQHPSQMVGNNAYLYGGAPMPYQATTIGSGGDSSYKNYAQGGSIEGEPRSHAARHLKMSKGGKVPVMVSPGERYLPPQAVEQVSEGKKSPMKAGEKIPGKAKVAGPVNSYANDTVPRKLDEGGIVIPRSITQGPDAEAKAQAFIKAILAKKASR